MLRWALIQARFGVPASGRASLPGPSGPAIPFLMMPLNELGKLLVVIGATVVVLGILLWTGFGRGWLGRLPGDVHYARGQFSFYFPIVTCLLLSVLLTFLFWLFRR
jgi:hypothetical protein